MVRVGRVWCIDRAACLPRCVTYVSTTSGFVHHVPLNRVAELRPRLRARVRSSTPSSIDGMFFKTGLDIRVRRAGLIDGQPQRFVGGRQMMIDASSSRPTNDWMRAILVTTDNRRDDRIANHHTPRRGRQQPTDDIVAYSEVDRGASRQGASLGEAGWIGYCGECPKNIAIVDDKDAKMKQLTDEKPQTARKRKSTRIGGDINEDPRRPLHRSRRTRRSQAQTVTQFRPVNLSRSRPRTCDHLRPRKSRAE